VRDALASHDVAGASLAASRFSLAWLVALIAGSLAVSCFLPLLIAVPSLTAADPPGILVAIPLGAAALIMLLSALAGTGLAIGAFFTGTGRRPRAVLALLLSVAVLLAYAVLAIGVIGLSG
jgi:hypothetical protein